MAFRIEQPKSRFRLETPQETGRFRIEPPSQKQRPRIDIKDVLGFLRRSVQPTPTDIPAVPGSLPFSQNTLRELTVGPTGQRIGALISEFGERTAGAVFPETQLPTRIDENTQIPQINPMKEAIKAVGRAAIETTVDTLRPDVLAILVAAGPISRLAGKIPLGGGKTLGGVLNTPIGRRLGRRLAPALTQPNLPGVAPESFLIPQEPVTVKEAALAAREGAAAILEKRPLSPDEILELYKIRYKLEIPQSIAKPPIQLEPSGMVKAAQKASEGKLPINAQAGKSALNKMFGNEAGFLALPEDDAALNEILKASVKVPGAQATAKFAENINLTKINNTAIKAAMQEQIAQRPAAAITPRITNKELIRRAESMKDTPTIQYISSLPEGTLEAEALRNRMDVLGQLRETLDKQVGSTLKSEFDTLVQQYRTPASVFARSTQAQSIPVDARIQVVKALDGAIARITKDPVMGGDRELIGSMRQFRNKIISKDFLTPTALDKIYFAWLNSVLSSPITHSVNMMSNLIFGWSKVPEKFFSAVADLPVAAVTGKRSQFFGEIPAMIRGTVPGSFQHRRIPIAEGTKFDVKRFTNPFGEGLGAKTIGIPTHLLQVEDDLSKSLVGKMELFAQIYKSSAQAGLKGKAARAAEQQLLSNPSEALMSKVNKEQLYRTFQDEPGKLGQFFLSARKQLPGVRWIIPFVRTPERIIHAAFVERTPAKLFSIARKAYRWKTIGERYTQEEFTKDAGQLMMASSVAGWAGFQFLKGNIVGDAPESAAERAAFFASGKKPNSFKIGDKWIPFERVEPWGTAVASVINVMQDYAKSSKEAPTDKVLDALGGIAQTLTQKTFLSGMTNFVRVMSDPDRYGGSFFSRSAAGFVPQGLNFAAQMQNPYYLRPDGLRDSIMAKIPILSEQVPKRLGRFGEPQRRDVLNIGTDQITKVDSELNRLEHRIGFPSTKIGGYKMSVREQNELLEMAGPISYQTIERLISLPEYQLLSDEEKKKEIDGIIREDREAARERMKVRLVDRALRKAKSKQEKTAILGRLKDQKVLSKELYFEFKERGLIN